MQSKSPSLAGRALLALLLTVGFYGLALLLAGILLFVIYAEIRWAHRINIRLTHFLSRRSGHHPLGHLAAHRPLSGAWPAPGTR